MSATSNIRNLSIRSALSVYCGKRLLPPIQPSSEHKPSPPLTWIIAFTSSSLSLLPLLPRFPHSIQRDPLKMWVSSCHFPALQLCPTASGLPPHSESVPESLSSHTSSAQFSPGAHFALLSWYLPFITVLPAPRSFWYLEFCTSLVWFSHLESPSPRYLYSGSPLLLKCYHIREAYGSYTLHSPSCYPTLTFLLLSLIFLLICLYFVYSARLQGGIEALFDSILCPQSLGLQLGA